MHNKTNSYLSAVFPLSLDKDCALQVVVPAGPEGALEEGATFDAYLDPGQREVLWVYHLTASDVILRRRNHMRKEENHKQG